MKANYEEDRKVVEPTIHIGLKTNLDATYHANQVNYRILNNIVFANIIVNINENSSTNTDDFYVEVPFNFNKDWLSPTIPCGNGNYIRCVPGTNKIKVYKGYHGTTTVKANEIAKNTYIIYAQFFAFIQ